MFSKFVLPHQAANSWVRLEIRCCKLRKMQQRISSLTHELAA
jgi:hypothetical protein